MATLKAAIHPGAENYPPATWEVWRPEGRRKGFLGMAADRLAKWSSEYAAYKLETRDWEIQRL